MTPKETAELWRQCEEARASRLQAGKSQDEAHESARCIWNAWASAMLVRRRELETSSHFIIERRSAYVGYIAAPTFGGNAATREWLQDARTDFSQSATFETRPNFGGFIFPGHVWFGVRLEKNRDKPRSSMPVLVSAKLCSTSMRFLTASSSSMSPLSGMRNFEGSHGLMSAGSRVLPRFFVPGFWAKCGLDKASFMASQILQMRYSSRMHRSAQQGVRELLI
jgi:hypothetical protein